MDATVAQEQSLADLTTEELEELAKKGVQQALEGMHSQGIATIAVKDGIIYKQFPDGRLERIAPVDSVWKGNDG